MVIAILILTAILYVRGTLRIRPASVARTPHWRALSFGLGLLSTAIAVASPLGSLDEVMLTAHMAQHLLLMTVAAPLIWLGAPAQSLMNALPFTTRLFSWPSMRGLGRVLGHPAFCWFSAAAALVMWHVPALLRLGMQSKIWHSVEQASFFTSGLLFWWPVVQPWPSVARWPRWSILLYLFLATLPCDVLSGLLVFSDRILYPMYLCERPDVGLSALEDQQCAGALMWTWVTFVFLVAGTLVSIPLLSPDGRGSNRMARAVEPSSVN